MVSYPTRPPLTSLSVGQRVSLFLLTIYTGLFAGLMFGGLMASILPTMSIPTYAEYWQIIDRYMGRRMPVFGRQRPERYRDDPRARAAW